MRIFAGVKTEDQFSAALRHADEIIADISLAGKLGNAGNAWLLLPEVLRENKFPAVKEAVLSARGIRGFVIQNIDEIGLLKELGRTEPVICGELLYCCNSEAVAFFKSVFQDIGFIAPAELTDEELRRLENVCGVSFIYKVYGRQQLMTTAQMIDGRLTNEKGVSYDAVCDKGRGLSRIYTGKPVSMLDKKQAWQGRDILIDFTTESGAEAADILAGMSAADFTRGHHYRGIV